jgi:hypothetical protein
VLGLREARYTTPAAPLELLAITLSFAVILVGAPLLALKLVLAPYWPTWLQAPVWQWNRGNERTPVTGQHSLMANRANDLDPPSRALAISDAVALIQRREATGSGTDSRPIVPTSLSRTNDIMRSATPEPIPSSAQVYRRTGSRVVGPRGTR